MAKRKTGFCNACNYAPVAFDAFCCPRCGAQNRKLRVADRFVGRGMLFGVLGGIVAGAAFGWFTEGTNPDTSRVARAVALGLLSGIPGLIVGMILGMLWMAVADVLGWRAERQLEVPADEFINADIRRVCYCGQCRQQQPQAEGGVCFECGSRTIFWNPSRETQAVAQRRWEKVQQTV